MRKHDPKRVSAVRTVRSTGQSSRVAKPVIVADHVEFGLSGLDPKERDQVKRAIGSWSRLWKLSKKAMFTGASGNSFADVSANLYLVFRVVPEQAEVIDLVNKQAYHSEEWTAARQAEASAQSPRFDDQPPSDLAKSRRRSSKRKKKQ